MCEREEHELGTGVEVELAHDVSPVRIDRPDDGITVVRIFAEMPACSRKQQEGYCGMIVPVGAPSEVLPFTSLFV